MRIPSGAPLSDRVLPSGPPPSAPVPLARFRLERTGKLYVHALTRVAREIDVVSPELVLYEIGEVARHEPGALSSAPNVLLLERMLDEAVRRLRGVKTSPVTVALLRSDAELRRAMAAWSNAVPEEMRVAIEMLVVSRRAPSPFCTMARRRPTEE